VKTFGAPHDQDRIERFLGAEPEEREISHGEYFAIGFVSGIAAGICLTVIAIVVLIKSFG